MEMEKTLPVDVQAAHRYFSTHCFNSTWDLIEKSERDPAEAMQMKLQAMASLWHWTQRPDVTNRQLAVGCWQASRVFALLHDGDQAHQFATRSIEYARDDEPFYVAYAHEALARASSVLQLSEYVEASIAEAERLSELITDEDDRQRLLDDLATIAR
jgi:predicted XRE-type DNA-binding protein